MKKYILLLIIYISTLGNLTAQYQVAYNQAKTQEKRGEYYKAIQSYGAANISRDKPANNDVDKRINFCANKLNDLREQAERATIIAQEHQKKALLAQKESEQLLIIAEEEKAKALSEGNRADSAVSSNLYSLYYYNSRDFAEMAQQLNHDKKLQAKLNIYSFKMMNFAYREYGKGLENKLDISLYQALIKTYFNNYGNIIHNYPHDFVYSGTHKLLRDSTSNILTNSFLVNPQNLKPSFDFSQSNQFENEAHVNNCIFISEDEIIYSDLNNDVSIQKENSSVQEVLFNTKTKVNTLLFSNETDKLYCGTSDKKLLVYSMKKDTVAEHEINITPYEFVKINKNKLAFTNIDNGIYTLNTLDLSIDTIYKTKTGERIYNLAYNSKTNFLFAGINSQVMAINFNKNNSTQKLLTSHKGLINNMKIDSEENKLFTSCQAGQILIWDFPTEYSDYQNSKPVILNFNTRIYSMNHLKTNNLLIFNTSKSLYYIPTDYNAILNVLTNKYKNLDMSKEQWQQLTRGNIELPK